MENIIPNFLMEQLQKQYGEEITEVILKGYQKKRKTTLRANTIKIDDITLQKKLTESNITFERVPWSKDAFVIGNIAEKEMEQLEIYQNGEIYVQSLSSMLPPIVLEPKPNETILDMAAAPGGKTTQMAAISGNKALITACERNPIRAERLKYNLQKQGVTGTYVMVRDARDLDDFFSFDKILLDAPCSGSGTIFVQDSNLKEIFTEKLVQKSTKTQFVLLKKAIQLLKPGREMLYSTCSILECENEAIIQKVLQDGKVEIVPIQIKNGDTIPLLPVKMNRYNLCMPNRAIRRFFYGKVEED